MQNLSGRGLDTYYLSASVAMRKIFCSYKYEIAIIILVYLLLILKGKFCWILQESLCIQFWDRESFIDEPIRCLLRSLEGEFPFRTVELVRLLSSLCEGTWPAECVWVYLFGKAVSYSGFWKAEWVVDLISIWVFG